MKITSQKLFYVFVLIIFLAEGLGLPLGRELTYYLILLFPLFLLIPHLVNKKPLLMPKILSFLFLGFLSSSIISLILGVNIPRSFEHLLFYFSTFLFFIYAYNHKKEILNIIPSLIFNLSLFLAVYSLIIPFIKQKVPFITPSTGYQLVYSTFGSHNHIGDLLVLGLIISFFKSNLLSLALLFPVFIISFSRSAYLSLTVVFPAMFFYLKRNIRLNLSPIIGTFLFFTILMFLFVTVKEAQNIPFTQKIHSFISENLPLKEKKFLGNREEYFQQAFSSIKENIFLGLGPNNSIYASIKYRKDPLSWSHSSHNIFLDILTENGIVGGFFFIAIIFFIFFQAFKNLKHSKSVMMFFFLFLALLINFQSDYTFKLYSFFLIFFIFAGLIYEESKTVEGKPIFAFLSAILAVIVFMMIVSDIFIKQNYYKVGFYLYPFSEKRIDLMFNDLISKGEYKNAVKILPLKETLFKGDAAILAKTGETYLYYKEEEKALRAFQQALFWNPYKISLKERINTLKKGY